jgi:hypothetical protein
MMQKDTQANILILDELPTLVDSYSRAVPVRHANHAK